MKPGEYWIICECTHTLESGKDVWKGWMKIHSGGRPVFNPAWRKATDQEIEYKRWHKGQFYFHEGCLNVNTVNQNV